ncbi:MAG: orotate phosphoribosyltransferase, partial [Alphaproteobacteria bacterium]
YPEGARLIGALMARKAAALRADYVTGLEMGAVPIVTAIAAMSAVAQQPVGAFFIRKQAKSHGTMSLIEGLTDDVDLAGSRVAVVEDVTTTGASALKAVSAIREAGAVVTDLITIVDREEGAPAAFAEAGITLHALYRKSEFAEDFASETITEPNP